jgi:hypothetical protein
MPESYTPAELAQRWKCSPDKVWAAIASKKLKAINTVFRANARKPRWVILVSEVERFELARMTGAGPKTTRQSRTAVGFNYF